LMKLDSIANSPGGKRTNSIPIVLV